jgi:hypothetical protein
MSKTIGNNHHGSGERKFITRSRSPTNCKQENHQPKLMWMNMYASATYRENSGTDSLHIVMVEPCFVYLQLINKAFSNTEYIASYYWIIGNYGLERKWKEVVVAQFKILTRHLPGGTEENFENLQSRYRHGRVAIKWKSFVVLFKTYRLYFRGRRISRARDQRESKWKTEQSAQVKVTLRLTVSQFVLVSSSVWGS